MPEILLVPTILIELGGSVALLCGWKTRWVALALFICIIPVTLAFHQFWAVDPGQMRNQLLHFLKNMAIMGGMLRVAAFGPGPLSLDKAR